MSGCVSLDGVPERQALYFCRRSSAVLRASALPSGRGLLSLPLCLVRVTSDRPKETGRAGRGGAAVARHGYLMTGPARVLFCDCCDASSRRTECGWRAYLTSGEDEQTVSILCPACAEVRVGENETAWSD